MTDLRKIIQNGVGQSSTQRQYGVGPTDFHVHNGIDSPRVKTFGYTGTIVTAPLTGSGITGSMIFKDGILISQTQST